MAPRYSSSERWTCSAMLHLVVHRSVRVFCSSKRYTSPAVGIEVSIEVSVRYMLNEAALSWKVYCRHRHDIPGREAHLAVHRLSCCVDHVHACAVLSSSGLVADIGLGAVLQLTLRAKTFATRPPVVHCVVEERDQSRLETPLLLAVNDIAQNCPRDDIIGGANSGLSLGQIWCRSRHVGDNGTT